MSALEQIRQRPILIISILGLALLLFILTAVDRPGELFTDNHTVAKVDGQKIDYMDFQRRVEQQQEQLQQQGYNNLDNAQVQQYVLQQMLNEALMQKEYDRLGLKVTDKELSEAMIGQTPHPYVARMVQQMGVPSAQVLYDAAFNPTKNGISPQQAQQLQAAWASLEKDTEQMLLASKFNNMFFGALNANKIDAQALYDDNAATSTIRYAKKDLSTLPDDKFDVSETELTEAYNKEKNRFRLDEPRTLVDYIAVDIVPSPDDLTAASHEVEDALAGLRANPGTEAVDGNSKFYVQRVSSPAGRLAPTLKNHLAQIQADTVALIAFVDNKYTLAKIMGSSTQTDSVLLDLAFLAPEVDNDSILARLNGGASKADLGQAVAQAQDSVWVSLLDPQLGLLKDEIAQAQTGTYFQPKNNNGQQGMAMRVRQRRAPVTVYDIAEITYDVAPSSATINKLNTDLRQYLTANTTSEDFKNNALKAGYNVQSTAVGPSSLSVAGLPETRSAAKWAVNASEGDVSSIFSDDREGRLLALAVTNVYDGKFMPQTNPQVRDYLQAKVRNHKKAAQLLADYQGKGKSVNDYAAVMGVKADTTRVNFGVAQVLNFPMGESALNANVAVAKEGSTVGPVELEHSVIVFEVLGVEKSGRPFDQASDGRMFAQREGAYTFQNQMYNVLLGNKKVDYRIQKFYSDQQE